MDVKQYLKRIRYNGPLNTEASTLANLCRCHVENVPFDTFDMFGGVPKTLCLNKIYNDIIIKKRGGICYETNGLFSWMLREIGFEVDILQSQVYVGSKKGFNPKYDHQCLMATTSEGDKWLVDVGFGNAFVLPLKWVLMEEQTQDCGIFRLRQENEDYFLEKVWKVVIGGREKRNERARSRDWYVLYKFTTTPCQLTEFEPMCKFHQEDEACFLGSNTLAYINIPSGFVITWGNAICEKKYVDHYTEEIVSVVVVNDEEEFKRMIKDKLGIVIDFPLKLKSKDYTGFADVLLL